MYPPAITAKSNTSIRRKSAIIRRYFRSVKPIFAGQII